MPSCTGHDHRLSPGLADAGSQPWQLFELSTAVSRSGDLCYRAVSWTTTWIDLPAGDPASNIQDVDFSPRLDFGALPRE
jgi:hypothetical protein